MAWQTWPWQMKAREPDTGQRDVCPHHQHMSMEEVPNPECQRGEKIRQVRVECCKCGGVWTHDPAEYFRPV